MSGSFAVMPWLWFLVRGVPALQGFAVLLPAAAVGGAVFATAVAVGRKRILALLVALSFLAFGVVVTVGPRRPIDMPAPLSPVTVVSANVYEGNPKPQAAIDALLGRGADITVAVEGSEEFQALLASDPATPAYRAAAHQLELVSRFPVRLEPTPASLPDKRVMVATVDTTDGPLTVFVVHALNPAYETTFAAQLDFVRRLRAAALATNARTLLIGDFNMSDRGEGYRDLAGTFRDVMRSDSWAGSTYDHRLWRLLFLRIDHAFLSPAWCAADPTRFTVPGSDHEGIAASIGPCALSK